MDELDKKQSDSEAQEVSVRKTPTKPIDKSEKMLEASDVEDFLPEHTQSVAWQPEKTQPVKEVPQPTATVVQQPATVSVTPPVLAKESGSGGLLVLQWLSYAFWLWFAVSTAWLAGVVINYYVSHSHAYEWGGQLAYPLAAVIIMLIISLVTDWFYAKHEPAKKTGGANIIMLLHVVPFVLFAIGSLITLVFSLITMLLNSDPVNNVDGPLQVMLVAAVTAVLFGIISARAFLGERRRARTIVWIVAGVLALGFIIASIAGPAAEAGRTKRDRLIETALPSLSSDIREYTVKYNKLPAKLSDVTHNNTSSAAAVQKLIDQNLVTYKPNSLPAEDGNSFTPGDDPVAMNGSSKTSSSTAYPNDYTQAKHYFYQLCTTYQYEKKSRYNYADNRPTYTTDLSSGATADYRYDYVSSISEHPAGQVCYNLYADGAATYKY